MNMLVDNPYGGLTGAPHLRTPPNVAVKPHPQQLGFGSGGFGGDLLSYTQQITAQAGFQGQQQPSMMSQIGTMALGLLFKFAENSMTPESIKARQEARERRQEERNNKRSEAKEKRAKKQEESRNKKISDFYDNTSKAGNVANSINEGISSILNGDNKKDAIAFITYADKNNDISESPLLKPLLSSARDLYGTNRFRKGKKNSLQDKFGTIAGKYEKINDQIKDLSPEQKQNFWLGDDNLFYDIQTDITDYINDDTKNDIPGDLIPKLTQRVMKSKAADIFTQLDKLGVNKSSFDVLEPHGDEGKGYKKDSVKKLFNDIKGANYECLISSDNILNEKLRTDSITIPQITEALALVVERKKAQEQKIKKLEELVKEAEVLGITDITTTSTSTPTQQYLSDKTKEINENWKNDVGFNKDCVDIETEVTKAIEGEKGKIAGEIFGDIDNNLLDGTDLTIVDDQIKISGPPETPIVDKNHLLYPFRNKEEIAELIKTKDSKASILGDIHLAITKIKKNKEAKEAFKTAGMVNAIVDKFHDSIFKGDEEGKRTQSKQALKDALKNACKDAVENLDPCDKDFEAKFKSSTSATTEKSKDLQSSYSSFFVKEKGPVGQTVDGAKDMAAAFAEFIQNMFSGDGGAGGTTPPPTS